MQKKRIAAQVLAVTGCLLLAAAAVAQEAGADSARQQMQQQLRNSMDLVLGMNPAPMQPGSYPMQAAMSEAINKIDPAVQASINEKLMKIMEQTIQETFSDARFMQEMQQQFSVMPSAPVVTAPPASAPPPSVEPLEDKVPAEETKKP